MFFNINISTKWREIDYDSCPMQENNLKAKNGLNDISDFKKSSSIYSVT